jgi:glutaredoxin 2
MKLYIYDHCPYCVKARMIFGIKNIPFELVTLLNDDDKTPISMIGQKLVPILEKSDGSYMGESMDIIKYIDNSDGVPALNYDMHNEKISHWLEEASRFTYQLCMPRWVQAPLAEFATESARNYFIKKKEAYIGDFAEHLANSDDLKAQANGSLQKLEPLLTHKYAADNNLSELDIHLFANLRSLSIVTDLNYPAKVEAYRQNMAKLTNISLHDDLSI